MLSDLGKQLKLQTISQIKKHARKANIYRYESPTAIQLSPLSNTFVGSFKCMMLNTHKLSSPKPYIPTLASLSTQQKTEKTELTEMPSMPTKGTQSSTPNNNRIRSRADRYTTTRISKQSEGSQSPLPDQCHFLRKRTGPYLQMDRNHTQNRDMNRYLALQSYTEMYTQNSAPKGLIISSAKIDGPDVSTPSNHTSKYPSRQQLVNIKEIRKLRSVNKNHSFNQKDITQNLGKTLIVCKTIGLEEAEVQSRLAAVVRKKEKSKSVTTKLIVSNSTFGGGILPPIETKQPEFNQTLTGTKKKIQTKAQNMTQNPVSFPKANGAVLQLNLTRWKESPLQKTTNRVSRFMSTGYGSPGVFANKHPQFSPWIIDQES